MLPSQECEPLTTAPGHPAPPALPTSAPLPPLSPPLRKGPPGSSGSIGCMSGAREPLSCHSVLPPYPSSPPPIPMGPPWDGARAPHARWEGRADVTVTGAGTVAAVTNWNRFDSGLLCPPLHPPPPQHNPERPLSKGATTTMGYIGGGGDPRIGIWGSPWRWHCGGFITPKHIGGGGGCGVSSQCLQGVPFHMANAGFYLMFRVIFFTK